MLTALRTLRPNYAALGRHHRRIQSHRRLVSSTSERRTEQPSPAAASSSPVVESKGKEKETAQAADASAVTKGDELPLLQRPLGVREKPTPKVKSWSDTKEKFMDQDKRLEERTHLYVSLLDYVLTAFALILQRRAREATRGYFSDLNATRRHGGKTWIAPKVMIREDVSSHPFQLHPLVALHAWC